MTLSIKIFNLNLNIPSFLKPHMKWHILSDNFFAYVYNKSMDFDEALIKGRIAETIFESMMKNDDRFEIIQLGYEHITPQLAQYGKFTHAQMVIDNIRNIPDFALISHDKQTVYLVEVKYMSNLDAERVLSFASQISARWNPAWLFVATPQGFYFDPCNEIVAQGGNLKKFDWINAASQEKYLNLLNKFESA